jgi:hypothetical protein
MSTQLRIPKPFIDNVREDLRRPHEFAFERVGFTFCRSGTLKSGNLLLPISYNAVRDADYLRDGTVGARIGSGAIRIAMQQALDNEVTVLHVHLHPHKGRPGMSAVDSSESQKLIPSFFNVRPNRPHGALILSEDSAAAWLWTNKQDRPIVLRDVSIIGSPVRLLRREASAAPNPSLIRQSFLGTDVDAILQTAKVAIVGLGGGGSHIAQQLVHLGIGHFLLFDPDVVHISNLNRLVGATLADAVNATKKVDVAERYIAGVNPEAVVERFDAKWQESGFAIREADVVFGCVDTFLARQEVESTARRYFIPYIDIGMDVTKQDGKHYTAGQVRSRMSGYVWLRLCRMQLSHD